MKAALQHVKDVQTNVLPVLIIARENLVWNNVRERVENVLTSVGNALMPAETTAAMLHNCSSNVLTPVAVALKNVKSMRRIIVSVALKSAAGAKKSAGGWQLNQ